MSNNDASMSASAVMGNVRKQLGMAAPSETPSYSSAPAALQWVPIGYTPLQKSSYVLGELLQLEDAAFVANAYRAILRREPDDHASALLDALRSGCSSKVEVLGDLRFSEEGYSKSVHVDGLLIPYKLRKWARNWRGGSILSWLTSVVKNGAWHERHTWAVGKNAADIQALGHVHNLLVGRFQSKSVIHEEMSAVVGARADRLEKRVDALDALIVELSTRLEDVAKRDRDGAIAAEHDRAKLNNQIQTITSKIDGLHEEVTSKIDRVHEAAISQIDDIHDAVTSKINGVREYVEAEIKKLKPVEQEDPRMDGLYAALEDTFRGSRELIRERVAQYLDFVSQVIGEDRTVPIIDLGSGRGEWIELLKERGFTSFGVERNRIFVDIARGRGQSIKEGDILANLKDIPSSSIGAVSMLHVAEHLTFTELVDMLDQSFRVLRNGGGLIIETPNPENSDVAQLGFYMDPTHRNPLPPALLHWLVVSRGFSDVNIVRLTEARPTFEVSLSGVEIGQNQALDALLAPKRASLDYAILAVKRVAAEAL